MNNINKIIAHTFIISSILTTVAAIDSIKDDINTARELEYRAMKSEVFISSKGKVLLRASDDISSERAYDEGFDAMILRERNGRWVVITLKPNTVFKAIDYLKTGKSYATANRAKRAVTDLC